MAVTTGFTGIGALLKLGDGGGPEVFTAVANITQIGIAQQANEVDATHLNSTSGFREYKQGFKDVTITFQGHFDPDTTTQDDSDGLMALFNTGASANFKIDFTDADNGGGTGAPTANGVASFSAVITGLDINADEGMVTISGTLRLSAVITWGAS
jgi:hypothetical protein